MQNALRSVSESPWSAESRNLFVGGFTQRRIGWLLSFTRVQLVPGSSRIYFWAVCRFVHESACCSDVGEDGSVRRQIVQRHSLWHGRSRSQTLDHTFATLRTWVVRKARVPSGTWEKPYGLVTLCGNSATSFDLVIPIKSQLRRCLVLQLQRVRSWSLNILSLFYNCQHCGRQGKLPAKTTGIGVHMSLPIYLVTSPGAALWRNRDCGRCLPPGRMADAFQKRSVPSYIPIWSSWMLLHPSSCNEWSKLCIR